MGTVTRKTAGRSISWRKLPKSIGHNTSGSAIIEGAVGFWLVIVMAVAGMFAFMSVSYVVYYKAKIAYVAQTAAQYAADLPLDIADANTPTCSVISDLLRGVGLPANSFNLGVYYTVVDAKGNVTNQPYQLNSTPAAKIVLTVCNLRLPGGGLLMPASMSFTETASAPRDPWVPDSVLILSCRQTNNTLGGPNTAMAIPTYGRYTTSSGQLSGLSEFVTDPNKAPSIALFPQPFNNTYYMSFPDGGFNAQLRWSESYSTGDVSKGQSYGWYDYPPYGSRNWAPPPADYPS